MTYLKFGTGIEEHFVSSHSLLPFHQYGYTEEEMAQTAFIVTGVFVACGEDAGSVFLQQGIVTEGVETEEEMSLLSSWGVDMIQGYYFSRPLPVDELLKLLNM